jgi:hypothetical protein
MVSWALPQSQCLTQGKDRGQLLSNGMKPITTENYPLLRTGQLVIYKKHQRQGHGKDIPDWCLKEASEYHEGIGCRFLVLNPMPESR